MGVFIDFQSAFDMWRTGLLIKLKNLGITGNIFNFIKKFLTDRSMQVKVGSAFSQKYTLDNGNHLSLLEITEVKLLSPVR